MSAVNEPSMPTLFCAVFDASSSQNNVIAVQAINNISSPFVKSENISLTTCLHYVFGFAHKTSRIFVLLFIRIKSAI